MSKIGCGLRISVMCVFVLITFDGACSGHRVTTLCSGRTGMVPQTSEKVDVAS
jgi:hypothetical protein